MFITQGLNCRLNKMFITINNLIRPLPFTQKTIF